MRRVNVYGSSAERAKLILRILFHTSSGDRQGLSIRVLVGNQGRTLG